MLIFRCFALHRAEDANRIALFEELRDAGRISGFPASLALALGGRSARQLPARVQIRGYAIWNRF